MKKILPRQWPLWIGVALGVGAYLSYIPLAIGALHPVDRLNQIGPGVPAWRLLSEVQLRIINLRKRTTSDEGAKDFGAQGHALDHLQNQITELLSEVQNAESRGAVPPGLQAKALAQARRVNQELDRLGAD